MADSHHAGDSEKLTMVHPETDRILALEAEIARHPGRVAWRRVDEHASTFETWSQRSAELSALLVAGEDDEDFVAETSRNIGPNPMRDAYRQALSTSLQAYLAAMVALVDVTRRITDSCASTELVTEFQSQNDAIRALPGVHVLRALRNYVMHYAAVPINFKWTIENDRMAGSIAVDSPTILGMKDLSSGAKAELEASPAGIRLRPVVESYHLAATATHRWLNEALNDLHQSDFEACNRLVAERNLLLTGGTHDGRDWPKFMEHVAENSRRAEAGLPQLDWQDRRKPPP